MSGMRMSVTTTPSNARVSTGSAARALAWASTWKPCSFSVWLLARRSSASSSMKTTRTAGLAGRAAAPDGGAEEADRLMMREGDALRSVRMNRAPRPGPWGAGNSGSVASAARSSPPNSATMSREITSPSPRPSGLVVWKGVNRPASASALRPGPLSWK